MSCSGASEYTSNPAVQRLGPEAATRQRHWFAARGENLLGKILRILHVLKNTTNSKNLHSFQ